MTSLPRTERIKRERFMPFRFARSGLHLSLREARLDDELLSVDSDALEQGELYLEDDRFETLHLQLQLTYTEGLLPGLLPESELANPPIHALVVLREARTRLRRAVRLPWDRGLDTGQPADIELAIRHDEIAGPVTIVPALARAARGTPTRGFAHAPGAHLASGRPVTIHPYAPRTRSGEFLDVQYRSFREDPQLCTEPYRLHFLDLASSQPVLFINSDHSEVVEALDARGQSGIKARLREAFYDTLSMGVWNQLFMHAAEALSVDGDTRHTWQNGVLAELLPQMFPHIRRHADRIAELLAIRDSDHALGQLSALSDHALQRRLDLVRHMQRLVQETIGAPQ